MALRKTEKKHLGKKRKSLSKGKTHSKQRITKKRYHKSGGDDKDPKPAEEARGAEKAIGTEQASGTEEAKVAKMTKVANKDKLKAAFDDLNFKYTNLLGGKAQSKKRTTKKRYHKGGLAPTPEQQFVNDLVDFINKRCPDVLKGRLLTCIDGGKIDDEFTGNNEDVETFVASLIAKIEQDTRPNQQVKDRMIECVLDASHERPRTVARLANRI